MQRSAPSGKYAKNMQMGNGQGCSLRLSASAVKTSGYHDRGDAEAQHNYSRVLY